MHERERERERRNSFKEKKDDLRWSSWRRGVELVYTVHEAFFSAREMIFIFFKKCNNILKRLEQLIKHNQDTSTSHFSYFDVMDWSKVRHVFVVFRWCKRTNKHILSSVLGGT